MGTELSEAFRIAQAASDPCLHYTFDWEFVPTFLERAVEVSLDCLVLREGWRDIAKDIGLTMKERWELRTYRTA